MNKKLDNRGSIWRKWDFHVHTPASHGFIGTWEQFEVQLKSSEAEVIGINDYFSVAGYKRIKERVDIGALEIGDRTILPVVEFRMKDILANRNSTRSGTNINFHIIFDNAIPIIKVETFIKGLSVESTQIADNYENPEYLRETAKVSFDEVTNSLEKNPDFKDKFLVLLPYDEHGGIGGINPMTDNLIKKGFVRKAHILGSSNKKEVDYFLWRSEVNENGEEKITQEEFHEWFTTKKPCIKGSDSHNHRYPIGKLQNADSQPIDKYCWVKAEPTFEGLKQVVFDPESRVHIGTLHPAQPTNFIDSILFNIPLHTEIIVGHKSDESKEIFCFEGLNQKFFLSPYFNCFIGGRGSGKSTILNFLGQHSKDTISSKTFWNKISPSFDTADKRIFSFDGVEMFEYIGQAEVESFATNQEAFTAAIYERANILSDGALEKNKNKLHTLLNNITLFRNIIQNAEDLKKSFSEKQKERRMLENSIKITESTKYENIIDKITIKSKQKQNLENWRTTINELREVIDVLNNEHLYSGLEQEIDDDFFINDPENRDIATGYSSAYKSVKSHIDLIKEILSKKKFKELEKREDSISIEIEKYEKELSELLKKSGLSEENVLQMKGAPQKLVKINDELSNISKRLEDKNRELENYKHVIADSVQAKLDYERVIDSSIMPLITMLESQASENKKKDIKNIGLKYFFDDEMAWQDIAESFYKYFSPLRKDDGERQDSLKKYIISHKDIFSQDQQEIKTLLINEENKSGYIKFLSEVFLDTTNFQIFQTIRDGRINDVSTYRRIQVLYDGQDIKRASFGQRCTAVMVILLLFGNYPLIIDEPEAHLDGPLIANYLVPLIKKKKHDRQIIFATHNANFVINGDAEKIFILKNDTGTTKIIETTIENLNNREELLKLEGGRDAFRKRGEKLSI